MAISTNVLLFIVGAGILQGTFLAALIYFYPNSDRSVNKFLSMYILCYCVPMLTSVVQEFFCWQRLILIEAFLTLVGPTLYLYVRSFKEEISFKKAYPHFIVFILYFSFNYYLYREFIAEFPPTKMVPHEIPFRPVVMVRVWFRITHMIVYFFLARAALASYQRAIQHLFSETSRISLSWVRWLINGYLVLLLLMVGLYVVILQNPANFAFIVLINTALVTPYLYAVAFKGITQPTLWQVKLGLNKDIIHEEIQEADEIGSHLTPLETKSQKVTISNDKRDDITSGIMDLMEKDRLFLQSDLTLQDLADRLNIPSYQITQAINEGLKKNFYELVNGYRVEEAKRMLLDPGSKGNKILTVGLDSGFNSKTTFNTVFKKFTGCTPSEFKEQQGIAIGHI